MRWGGTRPGLMNSQAMGAPCSHTRVRQGGEGSFPELDIHDSGGFSLPSSLALGGRWPAQPLWFLRLPHLNDEGNIESIVQGRRAS